MINLRLDEEALKHGIICLFTCKNIEIDENLSNEILLKTPCYNLAVTKDCELIEVECEAEDWERLNPSLFKGVYSFEDIEKVTFLEIQKIIKKKILSLLL